MYKFIFSTGPRAPMREAVLGPFVVQYQKNKMTRKPVSGSYSAYMSQPWQQLAGRQQHRQLWSQAKPFSSSVLLSSPELSDTKVYEPYIRALLGTASHFCEVVVLELITNPNPETLTQAKDLDARSRLSVDEVFSSSSLLSLQILEGP